MKRILMAIAALMLVVPLAACSGPDREGQTQMPSSSSNLVGEHYEMVVEELEGAGFTNVEAKPLGDLITGWLKDDGEVEKIRVDGKNTFSKGAWFPTDGKIVVTYHSFPEKEAEEAKEDAPETTTKPEATPKPKPEAKPKPSGASDAERSAVLEQRLKDIFGVDSMQELLVDMPDEWAGHVVGVRVEGDLAYFTLQVDRNTPDGKRLGEDAARALSTLLGEADVEGISWLIVEDGTGVVIDQKTPNPYY